MNFSYNGIVLDQLVRLLRRSSESVSDGPTYLYTRHMLHIMGRYNPDATSYDALGLPQPGNIAALTDTAVRNALMQPRQQLIITLDEDDMPGGEFVWISSPLEGYATDAANGPIPHHVDITQLLGAIHMDVEIIIEVNINECISVPHADVGSAPDHIVLSHILEATDDIDPNALTRRTVSGRMTLRTDAAIAADAMPDDFRAALFFPVMPNCQREDIHVTATEDGRQLVYSYADQEKMNLLTALAQQNCPGLVNLEASHTAEIGKPGFDDLMVPVGRSLARGGERLIRVGANGLIGAFLNIVPAVAMSALDLGITVAQLVPRQMHTVVARATGTRNADKQKLEAVALEFCKNRLTAAQVPDGSLLNTAHLTINYCWERTANQVEVTLRCKKGFGAQAFQSFFRITAGLAVALARQDFAPAQLAFEAEFRALPDQIMPGDGGMDALVPCASPQTAVQPYPPNDAGTRGTLIESLAVLVLQGQCGLPVAPALRGPVRNTGGQPAQAGQVRSYPVLE